MKAMDGHQGETNMSELTISSLRHPGKSAPAKALVSPVRLCAELYQIAGGPHGKGAAVLYRVRAICQQLHESHPDQDLLEQLHSLQELMVDWTSESGWKLHGNGSGPAALREKLMVCIDNVSGLAEPSGEGATTVSRMPLASAGAVSDAPLGASGV